MRRWSILLVAACLYPACSIAGKNIGYDISNPPTSTDIFFVTPGFSFGTHIDDAILQKIGCHYVIRDPVVSLGLLKLVDTALDVSQDEVDPKQKFEIRNKIVFHFANDDTSLEFSQKFSNLAYLKGSVNSEQVHLKKELVEKIHEVVKAAGMEQVNKNAPKLCD